MNWLFRIITLIALTAAPLAAPAVAMAPAQSASADCKQMDIGGSKHQMPASHHRSGEPCCIAVTAAIGPSPPAFEVAPQIDHPTFTVVSLPFCLGAGPQAEDPPPRLA